MPGRSPRWNRTRSSGRAGGGTRSGCCSARRRRGGRNWGRGGPPRRGLGVQLCGDAHLSNFGAFASPERNLVFDVNDFDETLPGPFEWDVKRLAASLIVAGRDNGFTAKACRKLALVSAEAYRTAMRQFAEQTLLDVWYAHLDVEPALAEVKAQIKAKRMKMFQKALAKAHTKD